MVHGRMLEVSRRKMASVMTCLVSARRKDRETSPMKPKPTGSPIPNR